MESTRPPARARLLVVEDDDAIRKLLETRLEKSGFEVHTAVDGDDALVRLSSTRYDLVLLDEMMPGTSGLEVLRRVRETFGPSELPVIMATAKSESDDVVRALALGANDFIAKPLDLKVLVARVEARLKMDRGLADEVTLTPEARFSPRAAGPPLAPGRVLDGRYRLESIIGEGGDGVVWRAKHVELDRAVAAKLMRVDVDARQLSRLRVEGISACRVNHPNAVQVNDFGVTVDGVAYLVMELLEGEDLALALHREKRFSPLRTLEILRPVASALAEAHASGVVHRDIKPGNIFLHRGRRGEVVKVLDFGIAHLLKAAPKPASSPTSPGPLVGTLSYTAPEHLEGAPVTESADVYSLGMVLYEMLTGAPPFDTLVHDDTTVAAMHLYKRPPAVSALRPDVPAALDEVLFAAVEKKPELRPSPEELARRFAAALEG